MQDKEDLHYVASQLTVNINVDDLVYELIGEISSDEDLDDAILEQYLVSPSQGMPRTKYMKRKTSNPPNLFVSPGGLPLALGGEPSNRPGMATRTSPGKRPILPSFSSDKDPENSGGSSRSKRSKKDEPAAQNKKKPSNKPPVPVKNIQRARGTLKPSVKELIGSWNRTARIGKQSETTKGGSGRQRSGEMNRTDYSIEHVQE